MKQINQTRIWKLNLPIVTANQVRLNLGHRAGAAVVSLAILLASGIVLTRYRQHKTLLIPAIALPVLLAGQITLGAYTVLLRKPADIASLHVAVGALTLLTTFILCTSAINLFAVRSGVATQTAEPFNGLAHEGLVPA
jgi:heme A synthase